MGRPSLMLREGRFPLGKNLWRIFCLPRCFLADMLRRVTTLITRKTTHIPRLIRPLARTLVLFSATLSPLAVAASKPKKDALPTVLETEDELTELRPAAEAGGAAAQVKPGYYYMSTCEEGYANEATAGECFRKAAEAGDAEDMAWYAIYLLMAAPNATREDAARAEPWALQAAEKGSAIGQYTMGTLSRSNGIEARERWHRMAARECPWRWYENAFDFDMYVKRYAVSIIRCRQVIRAHCTLYELYRLNHDEARAKKRAMGLVQCLKDMAEEGDAVAANLALAHLLRQKAAVM